jgi:hypothetical protein
MSSSRSCSAVGGATASLPASRLDDFAAFATASKAAHPQTPVRGRPFLAVPVNELGASATGPRPFEPSPAGLDDLEQRVGRLHAGRPPVRPRRRARGSRSVVLMEMMPPGDDKVDRQALRALSRTGIKQSFQHLICGAVIIACLPQGHSPTPRVYCLARGSEDFPFDGLGVTDGAGAFSDRLTHPAHSEAATARRMPVVALRRGARGGLAPRFSAWPGHDRLNTTVPCAPEVVSPHPGQSR